MYLIAWKFGLSVHVQPLYWVGGLSHRLQMRKQLLGVLIQTLHRPDWRPLAGKGAAQDRFVANRMSKDEKGIGNTAYLLS